MTTEDNDYLVSKLVQYGIFLICIATMLSVFQFSNNTFDVNDDFSVVMKNGYDRGTQDIGGGIIGTAIAYWLIGLLGEVGTVILCIGIAAIFLIFMFGIKPAELIADFVETRRENKEDRRQEKYEARAAKYEERKARNKEEIEETPRRETKKERRLREKEEQRREAEALAEQLTINLDEESENKKDKKLKKYDHKDDNLIPFNIGGRLKDKVEEKKEDKPNPDVLEANLFKAEQEQKEEKVKQVLQLEHTITVEDEHYEFPPIQLLSEGEKGVYDMSGGAYEYVAAYINNGSSNLTSYGSTLVNAASKYKDVYKVTSDSPENNYNNAQPTQGQGAPTKDTGYYGDAVWETSNSSKYSNSWYGDDSFFPNSGTPFFRRGGYYYSLSPAGVFNFDYEAFNIASDYTRLRFPRGRARTLM